MFVLGIDPGLSRCGYGVVERVGRRPRAVAAGRAAHRPGPRRPPPPGRAPGRAARRCSPSTGPAVVAVERVLFQVNVRTAMSVAQAAGVAMAEAVAAGCEVVEYSPNEVKQAVAGYGGRRQGPGRAHGADAARPRHAAAPGRRRRRRGAGPVPPGPRPAAAVPGGAGRGGGRAPWGRAGDRLAAGARCSTAAPARCSSRSAASATGRRVADDGGRARRRRATRSSSGSTTTSARTPSTLYGFATRDERVTFEALLGAHGVGPALALAILSVHAPARAAPASWPTTTSPRCAWCPASARRRRPGCWSSSSPGSTCPTPTSVPVTVGAGGRGDGERHRGAADVREALAGLGYRPTRSGRPPPSCPTTATPPVLADAGALLRLALQRLAGGR